MILLEELPAYLDVARPDKLIELVLDVVRLPHGPRIDEVVVAILGAILTLSPALVNVQKGLMVSRRMEQGPLLFHEMSVLLLVYPKDLFPNPFGGKHTHEGNHLLFYLE